MLCFYPSRKFLVVFAKVIFPQQRKLRGSSAQNSSGVHWCRRRVKFNEVLEKVPEVPEKVWEALVRSQVRFNRVPEKVPGSFGAKPSQIQQRFGRFRRPRLWCRARSGSTGLWRRFRRRSEGSVQSQVKFNRVPEKVPEKV